MSGLFLQVNDAYNKFRSAHDHTRSFKMLFKKRKKKRNLKPKDITLLLRPLRRQEWETEEWRCRRQEREKREKQGKKVKTQKTRMRNGKKEKPKIGEKREKKCDRRIKRVRMQARVVTRPTHTCSRTHSLAQPLFVCQYRESQFNETSRHCVCGLSFSSSGFEVSGHLPFF